jgi:hypothetical protein
MARTTRRQRKTTGRVMHEFKHGEFSRGRGGGKIKSRKQAIAIALNEAGASNRQSPKQKRKARSRTTKKEARGATGQQEREGRKNLGARPRRKRPNRWSAKRSVNPLANRRERPRNEQPGARYIDDRELGAAPPVISLWKKEKGHG